ncbi:hypothetical protein WP1_007 [Pseudomonas phage WP1]
MTRNFWTASCRCTFLRRSMVFAVSYLKAKPDAKPKAADQPVHPVNISAMQCSMAWMANWPAATSETRKYSRSRPATFAVATVNRTGLSTCLTISPIRARRPKSGLASCRARQLPEELHGP